MKSVITEKREFKYRGESLLQALLEEFVLLGFRCKDQSERFLNRIVA